MAYDKRGYSVIHDDHEFPKTFRLLDREGAQLAEIVYDAQEDALLLTASPGVKSAMVYHLIEHALSVTRAEYTYGDKHVFEFHAAGKDVERAVIQDLVFAHIKSTLNWIPVRTHEATDAPTMGIPYFGPCKILQDGIKPLIKILESWRTIYEQMPHPLSFHSGYIVQSESEWDDEEKDGKPSRMYWAGTRAKEVRVSKPVTLGNLSRMITLANMLTGAHDFIHYIGVQEGEPDLW